MVWSRRKIFQIYDAPHKALNLDLRGGRTQYLLWWLENGEIDNIQLKVLMVMIRTYSMIASGVQEIVEGNKAILAKL